MSGRRTSRGAPRASAQEATDKERLQQKLAALEAENARFQDLLGEALPKVGAPGTWRPVGELADKIRAARAQPPAVVQEQDRTDLAQETMKR